VTTDYCDVTLPYLVSPGLDSRHRKLTSEQVSAAVADASRDAVRHGQRAANKDESSVWDKRWN